MFGIGFVLDLANIVLALEAKCGSSVTALDGDYGCGEDNNRDFLGGRDFDKGLPITQPVNLHKKPAATFYERRIIAWHTKRIELEMDDALRFAREDPPIPGAERRLKELERELESLIRRIIL